MFMKDKGKSVALIISKLGKDKGYECDKPAPRNEDGDVKEYDMALNYASEEILDAIQSKDHKALKSRLKAFFELCKEAEEDEYEDAMEY